MKDRTGSFGIAMVYIGTVIGAGFASGQELYQFFARFGVLGLIGVSFSGVLFAFIGYIVLRKAGGSDSSDTEKMMMPFNCRPVEYVLKAFTGLFLFGLIVVMLAGSGALLEESFSTSSWIGSTAMMILCLITVLSGKSGIINSFKLAVPFLIFGMLAVIISSFADSDWSNISQEAADTGGSWIISAVLFVSYNMIAAISVLVPLGREIKTKSAALKGALVGGLTLGAVGFLTTFVIIINARAVSGVEVPLVHLATQLSGQAGRAYSFFLLAGIYTTAVGCLFALEEKLKPLFRFDKRILDLIIMSLALFLSNIGFSKLIGIVYPISGYIGLVFIAGILNYLFRKRAAKQI